MENQSEYIKKEHIELTDRLLLILENYKKYMNSRIKQWDNIKCNELEIANKEIDDLIDTFFSLVGE